MPPFVLEIVVGTDPTSATMGAGPVLTRSAPSTLKDSPRCKAKSTVMLNRRRAIRNLYLGRAGSLFHWPVWYLTYAYDKERRPDPSLANGCNRNSRNALRSNSSLSGFIRLQLTLPKS